MKRFYIPIFALMLFISGCVSSNNKNQNNLIVQDKSNIPVNIIPLPTKNVINKVDGFSKDSPPQTTPPQNNNNSVIVNKIEIGVVDVNKENFKSNALKCKKSSFFNIDSNIYFNVLENIKDSSMCDIVFSKFQNNSMNYITCSFFKKDLSSDLYDSLINEMGSSFDIKDITNKNCIFK